MGGLGEYPVCYCLDSLFFCLSPVDWFSRSLRHTKCFHARMCLFGVALILLLIYRRPPFWKIEKLRYLTNRLTDFDKIWQGDASGASAPDHQLKFLEFQNPRWRTAAILKIDRIGNDAGMYTCTRIYNNELCTRLQNYMIGASLRISCSMIFTFFCILDSLPLLNNLT